MTKRNWVFIIGIILSILFIIVIAISYYAHLKHKEYIKQKSEYSLHGLHPKVKTATELLIKRAQSKGLTIRITEGFRSFDQQNQLYEQGRTKPGTIVTNAKGGQSYHNYGLAVDFAIYDEKRHNLSWDINKDGNHNGISDWQEVVKEAKKLGFTWGGDWAKFKDYPHLQMTFGQTIGDLQEVVE